jgi:hypothetical protein
MARTVLVNDITLVSQLSFISRQLPPNGFSRWISGAG